MAFNEGMGFKPFGKRQPTQAEAAPAQEGGMSPELHVKLLRGMGDSVLNEFLDNWENIRGFQRLGHDGAARDDAKRLDKLFININDRLTSLGKRGVAREDLP